MRGVSEEWIKDALIVMENNIDHPGMGQAVIAFKTLLDHCYELNGWKPIDENTPKDRRIMLFYDNYGIHTGEFRCGHYLADANLCVPCNIKPKYWQYLPPLPKEK